MEVYACILGIFLLSPRTHTLGLCLLWLSSLLFLLFFDEKVHKSDATRTDQVTSLWKQTYILNIVFNPFAINPEEGENREEEEDNKILMLVYEDTSKRSKFLSFKSKTISALHVFGGFLAIISC